MVGIGRDMQTGEDVEIPASARTPFYCIGAPGMGKSALMENLISDDIAAGRAVAVFDFHFDLLLSLIARVPESRVKDIILLDITDSAYPFGLNRFTIANPDDPLAISQACSLVMHIFKKLYGKGGIVVDDAWGVLLEELLRNATMTFLEASSHTLCTMAEIPLLLEDDSLRNAIVATLTNRHVRNYWLNKYNRLSEKDQREERRSTLNRVSAFLTQPIVENIVGQSHSTIDFRRIIQERKILFVRLDNRLEDVSALIGAMLIAELLHTAYAQGDTPVSQRPTMSLYCDEFERIAIEDFAVLLSEGRKFGLDRIVLAHQFRDQLDRQNRAATLNIPSVAVFRCTPPDAEELAGLFDATPEKGEIMGYRPILTPKNDVVGHLLKQGHVNVCVTAFVNDYLHPSMRIVEANKRTPFNMRVSPRPGEPKRKVLITDLDEAINQLNTLLFHVSVEKNSERAIPPLVFMMFARLFGFSDGFAWYFTMYDFLRNEQAPTFFRPKKELLLLCAPDFLLHKDEIAQKISPHILTAALAFVTSLRLAMQGLAIDPVMVDTGQHEPIYQLRTFQDRTNEIASQLANLHRFHAKVKLVGADGKAVEHTIKTLAPASGIDTVALQARTERIKKQNIEDGYLRRREDVEKEIIARQTEFLQRDNQQHTFQDDEK